MSEVWKRWEGQVADHKYQLRQFLGSTDHSAVFLAEFRDPEPRQAAVKFISADLVNAERQLTAWTKAAQLSHVNLLRIYGTGRCKIEDMELLYVAMEHAEENLAQVLPQRALTAEETRDMLNPLVDVLVYLHDQKLTHGHIKPSNVHAIGEVLKLSSDTILPAGETRDMRRERSAYDAPELPASPCAPAADMWSLGVTLVEALTQQPADLPFDKQTDPVIPPAVRDVSQEIARHTLRRDPKRRWTSAQVAERLNPTAAKAVAATASASASAPEASASSPAPLPPPPVSPLHVPLSKEPAIPLAKLSPTAAARPAVPRPPVPRVPAPTAAREPRQPIVLPNYVVPLLGGVLVLIAIIALPKILRHREETASKPVASSVSPSVASAPAERASSSASRVEQPATQPVQTPARPPAATPAGAPARAVLRSSETTPAHTPRNSDSSPERGQVLDQVLPKASSAALASIQGTVRVAVKVHVDAAGNVAEAALSVPGPSRYFADLSLKTVRGWVFSPPEADGRSVPSDWTIQFYFTQSGVRAVPQQVAP